MDRPNSFNLGSDKIDFDLQNQAADFNLTVGAIRFDLYGETDASNIRLLEDGGYRLLEDGSFRLLE